MRILGFFVFFTLTILLTNPAWAASFRLTDKLIPGSAVFLQVRGFPEGSKLEGDIDKKKLLRYGEKEN